MDKPSFVRKNFDGKKKLSEGEKKTILNISK